ncbi:MAG: cupin domain-containing protein [Candidatus Bipolaricaulia bacterium]
MRAIKLGNSLWADSMGKVLTLVSPEDCRELMAGICTFKPGQRLPQEGFTSHEGAELSLMLSGELVVGTEEGERVVKSGELVLIEPGTRHYSENRGRAEARVIWVIAPAVNL